ncbi:hypothetical protein NC652_010321 [Populus alba x Populus x berolinensis]|nr:hypothetical protein NC652_010321 [Populus alba x Populus x berolinensis]
MANEHSPVLSSLFPLHDLIMASTSSPKSDDFGTATWMNKICWKPRSRVLAHVASLSPETVSLVHPPTRRPRPANEEETGERRASFASSNRSLQKEKQNS